MESNIYTAMISVRRMTRLGIIISLFLFCNFSEATQPSSDLCNSTLNKVFADKDDFDLFRLQAKNYELVGVSPNRTMISSKERAAMRQWVQRNLKDGYLQLNEPLAPEEPEYVVYNWASTSENYINLTKGISWSNLKVLTSKQKGPHEGIYAMSDPASAEFFGEVLMEIAVYKERVPISLPDEKIEWRTLNSSMFSVDPTQGLGAGNKLLFRKNFTTNSYLIQDLRAIKQLRFPDKKMILGTWFNLRSYKVMENYPAIKRLASQWLLTPNYSLRDRLEIIKQDKDLFVDSLSQMSPAIWQFSISRRYLSAHSLMLDNILRTLFETEGQIVDHFSGNINYAVLKESLNSLSEGSIIELIDIVKKLPESRLSESIKFVLNMRLPTNQQFELNLKKVLEANREKLSGYLAFDKTIFRDEINSIKDTETGSVERK